MGIKSRFKVRRLDDVVELHHGGFSGAVKVDELCLRSETPPPAGYQRDMQELAGEQVLGVNPGAFGSGVAC